ncbi:MAG: bifunctional aspartate kinase/homoserine dehydrogenase I [Bergeyella sp.]|nr:bifunctional aspartate kinase/homoserine dehydrogenase I [Bergeyella sp.]
MNVLKFGGSSVANAENILLVKKIIKKEAQKDRTVVVVSALSGVTDGLISAMNYASKKNPDYKKILEMLESKHLSLIKELIPITEQSTWLSFIKVHFNEIEEFCHSIFSLGECTGKTKDIISSYGELFSSRLITVKLLSDGMDAVWMDTSLYIKTNSQFSNAKVDLDLTYQNLKNYFEKNSHRIVIAPGFISSDKKGNKTTLGRGGSDYTASIISAALEVKSLQIWTDVSGMMTADPRWVNQAKVISDISYREAMELSHFGAKVIYPPTLQPLLDKKIDLYIKNTFFPDHAGTKVSSEISQKNKKDIAVGISNMSQISLLTLEGSGMVGVPGFSSKMFQALSERQINVILITQSSSEHSITVAIREEDTEKALQALNEAFRYELKLNKVNPIRFESSLSIIAIVGENMRSKSGVSAKLFGSLGANGINVHAIAQGSSERNISVVVHEKDAKKAVNALHEEFFETEIKQIHVFICGVGNVGSKLIEQIYSQNAYLEENILTHIRIAGVCNSKKMYFNDKGIQPSELGASLEKGEDYSTTRFAEKIIEKNLRNSVFIDVTASTDIVCIYERLMNKSIGVVACNKAATASSYKEYINLKNTAKNNNCHFLFETNVGAGLPIIGTIKDLIRSGDTITSIEAVLSGTLNFVFNEYDGSRPFSRVVRQAQEEGYTEPDPRLDLEGTDVARKILILVRESGYTLEFDDITIRSFLPEDCKKGSIENFYMNLDSHEEYFKNLFLEAKNEGKTLKYTAQYKDGKASVGLRHIAPEEDLYHLYGKDNIVILKTLRYSQQPLVVKGAGAGAEVTASGIFADIVRCI